MNPADSIPQTQNPSHSPGQVITHSLQKVINNQPLLRGIAVGLLLLFMMLLVTYTIPLPAAEDLPRQMMNGKEIIQGDFSSLTQNLYSYTQTNHYFANHHWLYGVFAYLLYEAVGWKGMVLIKILMILLTFWILFKASLQKANFWLVAISAVPAIVAISSRSALRPELFGYLFIAVYVYMLLKSEKQPSNQIFWLIPMQLFWANLHITWPIGPMIVLGFLVEKIILHPAPSLKQKFSLEGIRALWQNLLIQKLVLLTAFLIGVSFINPLGIHGVIYSLDKNIGANSDGPMVSSEVQPLSATINSAPVSSYRLVYFLIGLLALSFAIGFRRYNLFYFLGALATTLMALQVQRGEPFLGMFFLLAFPSNLTVAFEYLKKFIPRLIPKFKANLELILGWGLVLGLIYHIGFNTIPSLRHSNFGLGLGKDAEGAANFLIDNRIKGPIFNDTDIGSYLIWYLYPNQQVYADNRFGDAYSNEFFETDYVPAFTDEDAWTEIYNKYNFNAIVIYQYDGGGGVRDFIARRINDSGWAWVYGDRYSIILVRNLPANQHIIDKYAITRENMRGRFGYLISSLDGADQIAAADLFALGGAPNWARSSYAIALSQNPKWAKIWWVMGQMELLRGAQNDGDPGLAAMFIEKGIELGWKSPEAYSYLALAYYQMGFLDKAEEAVREELKINPDSEDGKRWMVVLAKAKLDKQDAETKAQQ